MATVLDDDFTDSAAPWDARIAVARASPAWYRDASGTWQQVGNNIARANAFQHHLVDGTPLGLLLEPLTVNLYPNSILSGGSSGTPGTTPPSTAMTTTGNGFTRTMAVELVENGLPCVQAQYVGNSVASGTIVMQSGTQTIPATVGQTVSYGCFQKVNGGSLANVTVSLRISERDAAGAQIGPMTTLQIAPTGANLGDQFFSVTRTITAPNCAFVLCSVQIPYGAGVAINFALRLSCCFTVVNSVIPSTPVASSAATTTKQRDALSITGATFAALWQTAQHTVNVAYRQLALGGNSAFVLNFSDGTANNRVVFVGNNGSTQFDDMSVTEMGGVQATLPPAAPDYPYTFVSIAGRIESNNFAAVRNGRRVFADISGQVPVVNQLSFGSSTSRIAIQKLVILDTAAPDWELRELSSLTTGQPGIENYMNLVQAPIMVQPIQNPWEYHVRFASRRWYCDDTDTSQVWKDFYIEPVLRVRFLAAFPTGSNRQFWVWVNEIGYAQPFDFMGTLYANGDEVFAATYHLASGQYPEGIPSIYDMFMLMGTLDSFVPADWAWTPGTTPFRMALYVGLSSDPGAVGMQGLLAANGDQVGFTDTIGAEFAFYGEDTLGSTPIRNYYRVAPVNTPTTWPAFNFNACQGQPTAPDLFMDPSIESLEPTRPTNIACTKLFNRASELLGKEYILDYVKFLYPWEGIIPLAHYEAFAASANYTWPVWRHPNG